MDSVPDAAAWEAFAGVASVIVFLSLLIGALWRMGLLRRGGASGRLAELETRLHRVCGELDAAREDLTSLRLRIGAIEVELPRPEALGRVHKRLDGLSTAVSHVEGQLQQIGRAVSLIQEHLLSKS